MIPETRPDEHDKFILRAYGEAGRRGIAMRTLIAHGADLTAKDANGRTPLDVARGAGGVRGGADAFPKTVALLESLMKAKGLPVAAVPGRQENSNEAKALAK